MSEFLSSFDSRQVHRRIQACAVVALLTLMGLPAQSQQAQDLTQKSLEDLMNIQVTSVSKKEQKTSEAAAAVFVISREDALRILSSPGNRELLRQGRVVVILGL